MLKPTRAAPGDWAGQLRRDTQFAEALLMKMGKVAPMAVLFCADAVRLVPYAHDVADNPHDFIRLVQVLAVAHDAAAVTFLSEAWVAKLTRDPGESELHFQTRAREHVRPSQAPGRIEVVYVSLCYRDTDTGERRVLGDVRAIERRANGKPTGLRPLTGDQPGDGDIIGRSVELLSEAAPNPAMQEAARAALRIMGFTEEASGPRRYDA